MCPRSSSFRPAFSEETILEAGFVAVETALEMIANHKDDPNFLKLQWDYDLKKNLLIIDKFAQTAAEGALELRLPGIEIRGEETSLADLTFKGEVAALLDMVDGTDLLERGLGNWCSAMSLFNKDRVWASIIGMPNGEIYYERSSREEAFVVKLPRKLGAASDAQTITVDDKPDMSLRDASVAFYGQKSKSLLTTTRHQGLLKVLDSIAQEAKAKQGQPDAPRFRIYNLAGNPMMMRLIEGKIDAIIELSGQKCHDIIPGFAIALKAKASLFDLETSERIELSDLPEMLAHPNNKYRYVMACNEALGREILGVLTAKV